MNITVKLLGGFSQYLPKNTRGDSFGVVVENGSSVFNLVSKIGLPSDLPKIILINGRPYGEPSEEKLLNDGDVVVVFPYVVGG